MRWYERNVVFILVIGFILLFNDHEFWLDHFTTQMQSSGKAEDTPFEHQQEKKENVLTKKLPKIVIVGVQQGGTAALAEILNLHPQLASHRFEEPEIQFWNNDTRYRQEGGMEEYKSLMPDSGPDQLVVIRTPSLLTGGYSGKAMRRQERHLRRMADTLEGVRLLLVVRNPLPRIISEVHHAFAEKEGIFYGEEMPSIDDFLMGNVVLKDPNGRNFLEVLVEKSDYAQLLQIILSIFMSKDVFILDGENMVWNPSAEIKKAEEWLGLQDFFNANQFSTQPGHGEFSCIIVPEVRCLGVLGRDKGMSHLPVKPKTVDKMRKTLQPMIDRFRSRTGVSLSIQ